MQAFMTVILLCSLRLIALLLVLSGIFKLFGKRLTASIRYTIWRVFAVIAAIPMNVNSPLINVNPSSDPSRAVPVGELPEVTASGSYNDSIGFWQMMFVLWIMGALAFFAYQIMKNAAVILHIKHWYFSDKEAETIFKQVKTELNVAKNVKFYRSKAAASPLTFGFIHQTVVIPFGDYNSDELRFIFKHELTHVSRRDSFFKWITLMIVSTYWFNPFIYLFLHQFNAECELSCDEKVTNGFSDEDCFAYGELILKSASKQKHYWQLYPSMAVRNSSLKIRLQQIVDRKKRDQNPFIDAVVFSVSIALVLLMPCVIGYGNIPMEEKIQHLESPFHIQPPSTPGTTSFDTIDYSATASTTEKTISTAERSSTDITTTTGPVSYPVNVSYSLGRSTVDTTTATQNKNRTENGSAVSTAIVTDSTIAAATTTATVYRHH